MEALQTALGKVMQLPEQHSGIQTNRLKTISILQNPSEVVCNNGVNGLDLIPSERVKPETFVKAKVYLEQAYGVEYPKEKFAILFDMINEEGWSEERLMRTVKWFLKTKYNQAWTIADWFQYGVKLYPFRWMRDYCAKNGIREVDFMKTLDCYLVEGVRLYKMKDGVDLPLEKIQ